MNSWSGYFPRRCFDRADASNALLLQNQSYQTDDENFHRLQTKRFALTKKFNRDETERFALVKNNHIERFGLIEGDKIKLLSVDSQM